PDHRLHRVPEAAGPRVRPDRADGWNGAHRRAERVGVDPRGRAPGAQVPDANLRAVGRTAERAADDVGPGLVLLRTGRRTSELAARWAGAPASLPGHRPSGAAALWQHAPSVPAPGSCRPPGRLSHFERPCAPGPSCSVDAPTRSARRA